MTIVEMLSNLFYQNTFLKLIFIKTFLDKVMQNVVCDFSLLLQKQLKSKPKNYLISQKQFSFNDFLSNSLIVKNGERNSKQKNLHQNNKIKRRAQTQPNINLHQLSNLYEFNIDEQTIRKNKSFIEKKISGIKSTSISKINKIYKTQFNQNDNLTTLSRSRENTTKSVLKKLSQKLAQSKDFQSQKVNYFPKMSKKKIFFQPQSIHEPKPNTKLSKYLEAFEKTENQRILRLLQKQQEVQHKYSSLKAKIQRQIERNVSKKLKKNDDFGKRISPKKSEAKNYYN